MKKSSRFWFFIFTVIMGLSGSLAARGQTKSPEELETEISDAIPAIYFEQAEAYAKEILTECPPEECVIVSFGMTNVLLDSFLRNLMREQGIDESYLRYLPLKNFKQAQTWSQETSDALFKLMLPPVEEVQGKTLMFTRTLLAGMTIHQMFPVVKDYYERQGFTGHLGAYLIADSLHTAKTAEAAVKRFGSFRGASIINVNLKYSMNFATRGISNPEDDVYTSAYEKYYRFEEVAVQRLSTAESNNWILQVSAHYQDLDRHIQKSKPNTSIFDPKNLIHQIKMKFKEECLRLVNFK